MKQMTAIVLAACLSAVASAKDRLPVAPALVHDTTTLSGQVLAHGSGVAAINEAAGDGNLQANADTISVGFVPRAQGAVSQRSGGEAAALFDGAAVISGHAFAGFSGILTINQAGGNGNLEANVVSIGVDLTPLTDAELGQVVSAVTQQAGDLGPSPPAVRRRIADGTGAFSGARGIVQVSQTVGIANRLANSFSLNISAGATP